MAKDERIMVRLEAVAKAALVKAATADRRSISTMAAKIIVEWLKKNAK